MTTETAAQKTKKPWYKRWWAIVLYVFIAMIIIGAMSGGFDEDEYPVPDKAEAEEPEEESQEPEEEEPQEEESEEPEEAEAEETEPEPKPEPQTPEEQIESATSADNVEANYEEGSDVLFVQFDIADNFSKGMIASGAQRDTMDLLEAVENSGLEYDKVFIQGDFPMGDEYGNVDDSMILNAGYMYETVGKINFDNITIADTIWDIRDQGMVHQELVD